MPVAETELPMRAGISEPSAGLDLRAAFQVSHSYIFRSLDLRELQGATRMASSNSSLRLGQVSCMARRVKIPAGWGMFWRAFPTLFY